MQIDVAAEEAPPPSETRVIEQGLIDHAIACGIEPRNHRTLAVMLRDGERRVVGGLAGTTVWGWLQVTMLWVDEAARGQGHGAALMRAAEAEAVRRGCHHARLDTFDFQAREFYERTRLRGLRHAAGVPARPHEILHAEGTLGCRRAPCPRRTAPFSIAPSTCSPPTPASSASPPAAPTGATRWTSSATSTWWSPSSRRSTTRSWPSDDGSPMSSGTLLAAFTGEHVGEPRLLICLYDRPLLHVDLKFVALPDVAARVEDPAVLWERDGRLTAALRGARRRTRSRIRSGSRIGSGSGSTTPRRRSAAASCSRRSTSSAFLRAIVLGPLALRRAGAQPTGVRKHRDVVPEFARELRRTVAAHDARDCIRAVRAAVELYRGLRAPDVVRGEAAERAAMQYLAEVEAQAR